MVERLSIKLKKEKYKMAMCKECGSVVGVDEIDNGICKACIAGGIVPEIKKEEISSKNVNVSDFGNPFSFRGRSGRLDYLVYGILLSYTIILGGILVGAKLGNQFILLGSILVGAIIALASVVRRTRDREENIVLVILLALIPYVGFAVMLYLLLAPGKRDEMLIETDKNVIEDKTQKIESTVA